MISVVIPTYNRADTITRAIMSVLNQTYKDLEVIVVDDNSNDNTDEVIKNIIDGRVKYYKFHENKGACAARNYGIEMSRGEYIAFQDSDDEWDKNKLKKQVDYLIKNNLDIVSCRVKSINNKCEKIFPINIEVNNDIYIKNKITTQTILGKRKCFMETKFNEDLPRFQDWELSLRLIKKYKVKIMEDILVNVYLQENSISKNPKKAVEALKFFLQNHNIDNRVEANYLRLMALYKMQADEEYNEYFRKAFFKNPLRKEILFDFIISSFRLKKFHYNFYLNRGRFK